MKKFSRPTHRVGLPPGTLGAAPAPDAARPTIRPTIRVVAYDSAAAEERRFDSVDECLAHHDPARTAWIAVDGPQDVAVIEALGRRFDLHPLMLEDVVNTVQRSKVERYGDATYVVVRTVEFDPASGEIHSVQVSLILVGNTLLTFVDGEPAGFETVRQRIRAGRPRLRDSGPAYLAYSLLDAVVDQYFVLLEALGEHMESVEDALVSDPGAETLAAIHRLKRELVYLRKTVWPLRETLAMMLRDEDLPFGGALHVYLRDLYDHTIHVIETIESYRDLNAGMLETHLSLVSNRMNEVMKTLTVIATLFIPLTFLVGVYGMNFTYMPELQVAWAYPALWVFMVGIAAAMLRFFRRRGWF